jgi:serine/threonine protein kinase
VTAANMVVSAAQVCTALGRLHRHGQTHRALSPDAIVVSGHPPAAVLRDLGQAGLASGAREGSGPYRAAEQTRIGAGREMPGLHTDVYQVAALVHHTLSGHPPLASGTPPVRASMPGFPVSLDDLLLRALDPDPAERPGMSELAAGLRQARSELSRGGAR